MDCQVKVTLRHIFRDACSIMKECRKTATFRNQERIDSFIEHIDKVVKPNILIGGCEFEKGVKHGISNECDSVLDKEKSAKRNKGGGNRDSQRVTSDNC